MALLVAVKEELGPNCSLAIDQKNTGERNPVEVSTANGEVSHPVRIDGLAPRIGQKRKRNTLLESELLQYGR